MSARRVKGFTLIELLVVIAIIAILAAMLFPVFARARESARKIQCLANVKNIAMAMQMYLTDYDRFPPGEHRAEVAQWFEDRGCDLSPGCCTRNTEANPYLRWPVVLDEYIKNRDVWRCPSAKNACTVMMVNPGPDWLSALEAASDQGTVCVCEGAYPKGWGGTVTDIVSDGCPAFASEDTGAQELDIFMGEEVSREKKTGQINDPAKYLVVAERGVKPKWWRIEQIAYPELCRIVWGEIASDPGGDCSLKDDCRADYEGVCGIYYGNIDKFWTDPSMRKQYARHLGGNNLGFADGHAVWMDADAMLAAAGNWRNPNSGLDGVQCQCLPNAWQ